MTVREYVGARYVPLFMGDWDIDLDYEPLSIVQYQGNSYTSRQSVPHGVNIANEQYWALTGNYNAQVEAYRQEVVQYDSRISATEGALPIADFDDANTVKKAIDDTNDLLPASSFSSVNTVAKAIQTEHDQMVQNDYDGWSAVWVGDSYVEAWSLQSDTTRFSHQVCDAFGLTEHNFAKGGTGYHITNGTAGTFYQQLQEAGADTSFDHDKVRYVFVGGGRNDANNAQSTTAGYTRGDVGTWISDIVNYSYTAFPNAKLVFIPMLYDCVAPSAAQMQLYGDLTFAIRDRAGRSNRKIALIENAYTWLNSKYSFIKNSDKIHPTQQGHNLIAANIINKLQGLEPIKNAFSTGMAIAVSDLDETADNFCRLIIDDNNQMWLHISVHTFANLAFGATLISETWNPVYESADSGPCLKGVFPLVCQHIYNGTRTTVPIQLEGYNNESTANAQCQIVVKYLGETHNDSYIKSFVGMIPLAPLGYSVYKAFI